MDRLQRRQLLFYAMLDLIEFSFRIGERSTNNNRDFCAVAYFNVTKCRLRNYRGRAVSKYDRGVFTKRAFRRCGYPTCSAGFFQRFRFSPMESL